MSQPIAAGAVHHLRLTVADVARSRAFYTEVLNFEHVMDLPPGVFLSNGAIGLGIGPSPEPRPMPGAVAAARTSTPKPNASSWTAN